MPSIQETNKAIMRDFVRVVQNEHNVEAIIERFFAPDFYNNECPEGFPRDREGDKVMHETLFKAFPDMKVDIIDMAAEGDTVWTMKDFYGTHTGSWLDIPPTGKKVKFRVIDVIKMRDGKFINHRQASDFVQLLEHLRVAAKAELKWFEHK